MADPSWPQKIRDLKTLREFWASTDQHFDTALHFLDKAEEARCLVSTIAKPSDNGAAAEKRVPAAAKPAAVLQHANCNMDASVDDASVDDASVDPQQLREERDALRKGRDEDEARLYDLEEQAIARDTELEALRSERDALVEQCKTKDAALEAERLVADKAEELRKNLEHELASTKHDLKLKLDQRNGDIDDLRANLDSAYAEIGHKDDEIRAQLKHKDDAEAKLYSVQLELEDAHEHYQASQKLIEERDSQIDALRALELSNATLQVEADSLQEKVHENERDKFVKDARIMQLENMYQKLLVDERKALEKQAREQEAVDPTVESPIAKQGQSLATELDEAGSDVDSDDFQGNLDQSDLAPALEFSEIKTVDTAPVVPVPAQVATQNQPTQLGLTAPKVVMDLAPIVHKELPTQTQTQTEPTTVLDLAPIVQASNTQTEPTTFLNLAPVIGASSTQTEPEVVLDLAPVVHKEQQTQTEPTTLLNLEPGVGASSSQTKPEVVLDLAPIIHRETQTQTEPTTILDVKPVVQESSAQTDPEVVLDLAPVTHRESHAQTDPEVVLDLAPVIHREMQTQTEPTTVLDLAPTTQVSSTQTDPTTVVDLAPSTLKQNTQNNLVTILDLAPIMSQATSTQTEPATTLDLEPIATTQIQRATKDEDTQTDFLSPYTLSPIDDEKPTQPSSPHLLMLDYPTQTDPQTPIHPATPHLAPQPKKKGGFIRWSTILSLVFCFIGAVFYSNAHAMRHTHPLTCSNRLYQSMGYRKRGRHLFAFIPVCYEMQSNFVGEALCEQWEVGVKALENYFGVVHPRRY